MPLRGDTELGAPSWGRVGDGVWDGVWEVVWEAVCGSVCGSDRVRVGTVTAVCGSVCGSALTAATAAVCV